MRLELRQRVGLTRVIVGGDLSRVGMVDLSQALDELLTDLDPDPRRAPFFLWDLTGAGGLTEQAFAALVAWSVLLRLHGFEPHVAGLPPGFGPVFARSGAASVLPGWTRVEEALEGMIARIAPGSGPAGEARFPGDTAGAGGFARGADPVELLEERLARSHEERETAQGHPVPGFGRWIPDRVLERHPAGVPDRKPAGPRPIERVLDSDEPGWRLGDLLRDQDLITPEQLDEALAQQKFRKASARLGSVLIQMGIVTEEQIFAALEDQYRRRHLRFGGQKLDLKSPREPDGNWSRRARQAGASLLGEKLVKRELVTREDLDAALRIQWEEGARRPLGTILVEMGKITPEQILEVLEEKGAGSPGEVRSATE